jgi:hypothetical protein
LAECSKPEDHVACRGSLNYQTELIERKTLAKGLAHIISQTGYFLTVWLNIAVRDRETVQAVKKAFGDFLWQWLDFDFTDDIKVIDTLPNS